MTNAAVKLVPENLENIIETMLPNTKDAIWMFEQFHHYSETGEDVYAVRFQDPDLAGSSQFGVTTENIVLNNPQYYTVHDKF